MTNTLPSQELTVQFWGVRGNIPSPGIDTTRYGGNTACVEILAAGHRLIFDGGTGLRVLGQHLLDTGKPVQAHLFFTHPHWDRIQGFPFFAPAFAAQNRFDIYAGSAANGASIKQCLMSQMLRPNFFTPLQEMLSEMTFHNISAGNVISLSDDVAVETINLNPQTSALGFRVTHGGKSIVYATDSGDAASDQNLNLLYLAKGADLLIYGGTYSEAILKGADDVTKMPWEHSIDLAEKAQVKEMILFHHAPSHVDAYLERIEKDIQGRSSRVQLAREGMILKVASAPFNS